MSIPSFKLSGKDVRRWFGLSKLRVARCDAASRHGHYHRDSGDGVGVATLRRSRSGTEAEFAAEILGGIGTLVSTFQEGTKENTQQPRVDR